MMHVDGVARAVVYQPELTLHDVVTRYCTVRGLDIATFITDTGEIPDFARKLSDIPNRSVTFRTSTLCVPFLSTSHLPC